MPRHARSRHARARYRLLPSALLSFAVSASGIAQAGTWVVTSPAELEAAIQQVNSTAGAHFIEFGGSITLTGPLTPITATVTIKGNGHTLSGDGQYRLLELGADSGRRVLVQVGALRLVDGLATGDAGAGGEGGGLGAGGAIRINSRADVVLNDVTLAQSAAVGGDGSTGGAPGTAGGYGEGGAAGGGAGGVGAGDGGATGGGAGAGLGGAIFVADGGNLSLAGSSMLLGNAVQAGSAGGDGAAAAAAGSGIFLQGSGNLVLWATGSETMVIGDDIVDAAGAGLDGASATDDIWNVRITGGGVPLDGAEPLPGFSYARVVLAGDNRFSGDLYVSGADLLVQNISGLGGPATTLAIDDGGIYLANGVTLDNDVVINSGGGRLGVDSGVATFAGDLAGNGPMYKVGGGDLVLAGTGNGAGSWEVIDGALVLHSDAVLGTGTLKFNGGGLRYGSAFNDLRAFEVDDVQMFIDNGGHDVHLTNAITGTGGVLFEGSGDFYVDAVPTNSGENNIAAGTDVIGRLGSGPLGIAAGGSFTLTGNQLLRGLVGDGDVLLNGNTLDVQVTGTSDSPLTLSFGGEISGNGMLSVGGNMYGTFELLGANTYTGGTRISGGVLAINDDAAVNHGDVTLTGGGTLALSQANSQLDIEVQGIGTIRTGAGTVVLDGVISDNGSPVMLLKRGAGTLVLNNANTYSGTTVVTGEGSLLALGHAQGLGNSNLSLSNGGGLRLLTDTADLLAVDLTLGDGIIDTNGFDAVVNNGFSGSGNLVKAGLGTLFLLDDGGYSGTTRIAGGMLEVGAGGSLGGNGVTIESGAVLNFNRSGSVTLGGDLEGQGELRQSGSGTLALTTTNNLFNGSVQVLGGLLQFYDKGQLGRVPVFLDNLGALELDVTLDPDALAVAVAEIDVELGAAGGALHAGAAGNWTLAGDVAGAGALHKTGAGTVVFTGVAEHLGGTAVDAGRLQVGSGLRGTLTGDVAVAGGAVLAFGRDDLVQFTDDITGAGSLEKTGLGELVLTGNNLLTGLSRVLQGNLRIGYGGTSGSLAGDVDLAAGTVLLFDRADTYVHDGDTSGAGSVTKNGAGTVVLLGDAAHTGGTTVNGGALQVGANGTVGSLAGNVQLLGGSQLVLARSDALTMAGNLSGSGRLIQAGDGTTTLAGDNSLLSGGVQILDGRLAIDADARLGSGSLAMNGGLLRYAAAFDDLRGFTIGASGGGIDTNGHDVRFDELASGSGTFRKTGAGTLTVTGILASAGVTVDDGELRIGDGGTDGVMIGNAAIAAPGRFAFDRADDLLFGGVLSGDGTFVQQGDGVLRLSGDSNLFAGDTQVAAGTLRIDNRLGGDVGVLSGARLTGAGRIGGNLALAAGGVLETGTGIGTLTVDGNATFDPLATWRVEVSEAGTGDRLAVGGNAVLGGNVEVLAGGGDYNTGITYRILDASLLSGTFAGVQSDLVFLTPTLLYGANYVDLRLVRNGTAFTTVSLTRNQQAVAGALDLMDPLHPVVTHVQALGAQDARDAYDALNGDSLLAGVDASRRTGLLFGDRLRARASRLGIASRGPAADERFAAVMQGLAGGDSIDAFPAWGELPAQLASRAAGEARAASPVSRVDGVWIEVQQTQASEREDDVIGNAATQVDGQLMLLGFDGYWRDDLILGAAVGMGSGSFDFDNREGSGEVDSLLFGVYGRWDLASRLQVKAALAFGQGDIDQTRVDPVSTLTLSSSAGTQMQSLVVEAGSPTHVAAWGMRPFVSLAFGNVARDAFSETPSTAAGALSVAATDAAGGHFGLGVEASRPWLLGGSRWAQFEGTLELRQPFGDVAIEQRGSFTGSGQWYEVQSAEDDSASLALALGMEAYLVRNVAVWGGYRGRFGGAVEEHGFLLSLAARW